MLDFRGIFELDKWLEIYLILTIIDMITGFLKAYKVQGFKSRKLRDGVVRIISELVAIMFAGVLDLTFELNILMISTKTIFVFKQSVSIVENLGLLGIELPKILTDKIYDLNQNKDTNNKEEEV